MPCHVSLTWKFFNYQFLAHLTHMIENSLSQFRFRNYVYTDSKQWNMHHLDVTPAVLLAIEFHISVFSCRIMCMPDNTNIYFHHLTSWGYRHDKNCIWKYALIQPYSRYRTLSVKNACIDLQVRFCRMVYTSISTTGNGPMTL